MQTVLQVLDYDRLLEKLAGYANSTAGAELCLAIKPMAEQSDLRLALAQTSEMRAILDFDQAIPLGVCPDLRPL